MQKRKLGRSGIDVSLLSLGCWALAGGDGWGDQDERSAIATIHAALDQGINFFDTAEGYAGGRSEEIVGKALADRRREAVIASKISPNHTAPSELRGYLEAALRRMQTDYVDVYMIHWPIRSHPVEESLAVLQALKQEGKLRAIGVSNFGVQDLTEAVETGVEIDVNQLHYSLLSRAIEYEILPLCRDLEVGVTTYMPLMQGLLTGKYRTLDEVPPFRLRTRHFSSDRPLSRHDAPGAEDEVVEALSAVRAVAQELGESMANVALAWVMAKPGIVSVIAGARSPDQVARNVQATSLSLSPEVVDRLDAATAPLKQALGPNADYWQTGEKSRIR
jgi:aryl-alcohol dehydrogenase-like predicted oxidoreductase